MRMHGFTCARILESRKISLTASINSQRFAPTEITYMRRTCTCVVSYMHVMCTGVRSAVKGNPGVHVHSYKLERVSTQGTMIIVYLLQLYCMYLSSTSWLMAYDAGRRQAAKTITGRPSRSHPGEREREGRRVKGGGRKGGVSEGRREEGREGRREWWRQKGGVSEGRREEGREGRREWSRQRGRSE